MSLSTEIIPFTLRTGTGTQTVNHIVHTTVQARAYIFFSTATTGTNSRASYSFGIDDGAMHIGTGMGMTETFGSCLTARGYSSQFSMVTEQSQAFFGGAQMRFRGYVSALAVGSFTLTTDLNGTPGAQWYAFMIGGDNVECKVGNYLPNGPGPEVIGFSPVAFVKLGAPGTGTTGEVFNIYHTYGFGGQCDGAQVGWGVATNSTAAKNYFVPDIISATVAGGDTTGLPPSGQRTIDSWDASGVTFGGATVGAGEYRIGYLAIGGSAVSANLVPVTQPTSTGVQNVTLDAVSPKAVLFGSTDCVASVNVEADLKLSFGVYDGTSQVSQWIGMPNGTGFPFSQHSRTSTTKAFIAATATGAGTSTVNADATCTLSSQNLAINWTTVDATQRTLYALVLADNLADYDNPCGLSPFNNSLTVTKVSVPPGPQSFDFTTTGGLSPSTFSLSNGQSQVYSDLTPGTYGVTETPISPWSVSYAVSNDDPHDAIVIGATDTITVTVTNTYGTTVKQLRRYRRFALPWSSNYFLYLQRAELIAQMGVGTSILNPTVYLRFSRDGGKSWPITRTVTLGLQGDYEKRAYTLALGEARSWLVEVYMDDPVFCGWIAFDVDLEQGAS